MNQLERDYLLAQSVIKSLEQENARLLFFNRELVEENRQLKELNREMVEALKEVTSNYYDDYTLPQSVVTHVRQVLQKVKAEVKGNE